MTAAGRSPAQAGGAAVLHRYCYRRLWRWEKNVCVGRSLRRVRRCRGVRGKGCRPRLVRGRADRSGPGRCRRRGNRAQSWSCRLCGARSDSDPGEVDQSCRDAILGTPPRERGRTDGVNAERRRIRKRWADPRGVRFFPDAVNKPIGFSPSGGCKGDEGKGREGEKRSRNVMKALTTGNVDTRAQSRSGRDPPP